MSAEWLHIEESCKGRELSFLAHCAVKCRSGLRIAELKFTDKIAVAVCYLM